MIAVHEINLPAAWSAALALVQALHGNGDVPFVLALLKTALRLDRVHIEQWLESKQLPEYALALGQVWRMLRDLPEGEALAAVKPDLLAKLKSSILGIMAAHPREYSEGKALGVLEAAGLVAAAATAPSF